MSERKLTTLHLFLSYLPAAANWVYRMMVNLPNSDLKVAAYAYHEEQFHTPNVEMLPLPEWVKGELVEGNFKEEPSFFAKPIYKVKHQILNSQFFDIIAKQAEKWNVDLIHVHFANMGWHFLKLKELTNLPYIVSFYGFDYESLPFMFPSWESRYQELFEKADLFICEGPFGASILKNKGCAESKIRVVHLGVDTQKIPFIPRQKKENELSLIQICNFAEKKGQIYSAMAFAETFKRCPNMSLTFVGHLNKKIMKEIKEVFQSSGNLDRMHFIERVEFAKLYEFMGNYQVFIHPSCYADNRDCEGGAPVVLLDAEGTGMPVISTVHCDIPEEVIQEETGLLSGEKDVAGLASSIERFYKMGNEEYQRFSFAARKHIERNFEIKHCASQLEKVYREVVKS